MKTFKNILCWWHLLPVWGFFKAPFPLRIWKKLSIEETESLPLNQLSQVSTASAVTKIPKGMLNKEVYRVYVGMFHIWRNVIKNFHFQEAVSNIQLPTSLIAHKNKQPMKCFTCVALFYTHTHKHPSPSTHRMNYKTDNLERCHLLEIQKMMKINQSFHRVSVRMKNPLILASSATTDSHCSSKAQIAAKANQNVLLYLLNCIRFTGSLKHKTGIWHVPVAYGILWEKFLA